MAKQTFTAGQVLTATQMNNLQANDYNWTTSAQTSSYVLTAANAGQTVTMTNAAATTITVNTGLFTAGDTVRILNLGAGATTITAGTATVNTAGSLVLPQYGSGTLWFSSASAAIFIPDDRNAGLTLVKTQTIGTTVSSVTVSDAFSSTYDVYEVIVSGGASSTNNELNLTFGAATSNYRWSVIGNNYAASLTANGSFSASSIALVGNGTTTSISLSMRIVNPFLAEQTMVSTNLWFDNVNIGSGRGYLNDTNSYTAFTLTTNTGTLTGGTIRVYGYQNS